MDIITSDTFGRQIKKLTHQEVVKILSHPHENMSHLFVHDPKMVIISRTKNNGVWTILVEELFDDDIDNSPLLPIYSVRFKDEEIDAAINLFFSLIKSQRKDFEQYIYKKLGKYIFLSPNKISNNQTYLYETFRKSIKCCLDRKRRQSVARTRKNRY
jgi:hypothetical protein